MPQPRNTAPIDESVKVPDAVRRASERASQVHQQAYGTTPPAADGAPANDGNGQGAAQPQNQPPAAPPAAAPASPAPVTIPEEPTRSEHIEPGSYEARYWAMKGRFDQSQRRVVDQENRLVHMEQLLADVSTRQPIPQAEPQLDPARPASEQRFITDKERDEYGPELTDMIQRVAKDIAGQQLATANAEIASLKQQVGGVQNTVATDARSRLLAMLDNQLASWRTQNQDPEFLAWLELPDVYSGARRMDLLRQAFDRGDGARVLAFFNGYNAEVKAAAPAPTTPAAPPAPAVRLEDLAAPGRARTAATSQPPVGDKPLITAAQISQFYDDCRRGRYNGRDADRIALEQQIFEAQREGRIR